MLREMVTWPIVQNRAAHNEPSLGQERDRDSMSFSLWITSWHSFFPSWKRGGRCEMLLKGNTCLSHHNGTFRLVNDYCTIFNSKRQNLTYVVLRYL